MADVPFRAHCRLEDRVLPLLASFVSSVEGRAIALPPFPEQPAIFESRPADDHAFRLVIRPSLHLLRWLENAQAVVDAADGSPRPHTTKPGTSSA